MVVLITQLEGDPPPAQILINRSTISGNTATGSTLQTIPPPELVPAGTLPLMTESVTARLPHAEHTRPGPPLSCDTELVKLSNPSPWPVVRTPPAPLSVNWESATVSAPSVRPTPSREF